MAAETLLILSWPGCRCARAPDPPQISAQQWGAATKDEVATRVHGVCPLPMGIEREETCE